jgi:phage gpG-like protein
MSNLIVTMKAEALLSRLAGTHERLLGDLRVVVRRLAIKAQGVVKGEKLTGQVLHVRTGTLRRSINQQIEETGTGIFAKVGTNVKYAAIHEYGFDGAETVRAHTRLGHPVRAHVREVHMPKRSFLVATLNEMSEEIRTTLRATILKAVRP